jgi:peptidyl-tRNA hydrolase, PTH1 family
MALFQRRPSSSDSIKYYTLGQNKILMIVGLGNPGKEYDGTRHNIGFACLDEFAKANDFDPWVDKRDLKCQVASTQLGESRVLLVKPTTFMNLSGEAAQAVANFYKIPAENIVAVYDEIDIPFGQIRMRVGGSSAGHNGVKSLIQHLGENFGRVRVGIGPKEPEQMDSADFVLAKFSSEQQAQLKNLAKEAAAILSEYTYQGELPHDTRNFIV